MRSVGQFSLEVPQMVTFREHLSTQPPCVPSLGFLGRGGFWVFRLK